MNQADLENYMREMTRIGAETEPFLKAWMNFQLFLLEHWILTLVTILTIWAVHTYATWTNLRDNRGVDRLTWLLVIWMFPVGIFFYWRLGQDSSDSPAVTSAITPLPPRDTTVDTAAAVSAALSDEVRKRRR